MAYNEIFCQTIQALERKERSPISTIVNVGGQEIIKETWRGLKKREIYSTSYPVKVIIGVREKPQVLATGKLVVQICKDRTMLVVHDNSISGGVVLNDVYNLFTLLSDSAISSSNIEEGRVWVVEKHVGVWGQRDEVALIRQRPEGIDIPFDASRTKSDMVVSFSQVVEMVSDSLVQITYG